MIFSSLFLQLAVDFLFCLVLIEILKQLNFHPGYDDLIDKIVQMSFSHFKLNERYTIIFYLYMPRVASP